MTAPLRLTIPTQHGEIRLSRDGNACDLQSWTKYSDGHAMMAGGVRLQSQDLRLLLHAVKYALFDVEREEFHQRNGAPSTQELAA